MPAIPCSGAAFNITAFCGGAAWKTLVNKKAAVRRQGFVEAVHVKSFGMFNTVQQRAVCPVKREGIVQAHELYNDKHNVVPFMRQKRPILIIAFELPSLLVQCTMCTGILRPPKPCGATLRGALYCERHHTVSRLRDTKSFPGAFILQAAEHLAAPPGDLRGGLWTRGHATQVLEAIPRSTSDVESPPPPQHRLHEPSSYQRGPNAPSTEARLAAQIS
ncbi:hypothetical protein ON010_g4984 [Phytophthora cinnamomi]|nr:hypothetical protein ON010_g4984 [Phytophthora cinnamomi]